MELDKNIEQQLAGLLVDPAKVSSSHAPMLQELLQEYPYYQPLHLLLAKANQQSADSNTLAKASLYTNGQLLHQFLFTAKKPAATAYPATAAILTTAESSLSADEAVIAETPIADDQETFEEISEVIPMHHLDEVQDKHEPDESPERLSELNEQETFEEISELVPVHSTAVQEKPEADEDPESITAPDEEETFEEIYELVPVHAPEALHNAEADENADPVAELNEQETFEEISELAPLPAAEIQGNQEAAENADPVTELNTQEETGEEEVYEEIAEVDISNYRPFRNSDQPGGAAKPPQQQENSTERRHTTEDELMLESIVSADFFAFEQSMATEEVKNQEEKIPFKPPVIEEHDEIAAAETAHSRVSNYHDEKLPYTFLWWLAKTRKEHQSIFQPYAAPKKSVSPELQHQYVEHIFHLQSHLTGNEELLDATEGPAKPISKDFEIIESFIRNDPQITPPNAEQIDNENKAKKSAEDQNDLVSETLANIYIEQMLYDKAIDTYEKLSLKFPEKSRYFADLIQSIEKKI